MTPQPRNYVTYFRVSTQRQGRSGLGIEAQKASVKAYLDAHGGAVLATWTEIESGKRNDRPALEAALKRCRQTRATLLVARLDRLSRNAAFLLTLRDSGARFVACDMPDMNETVVGILAVIAQHEREAISARTKAALQAARRRGVRLGNPRLRPGTARSAAHASAANAGKAEARALELRDVIEDARTTGCETLVEIAQHLDSLSIRTARGAAWTATGVRRALMYLDARP